MKNIVRASLVVLTLAGMYAGFATPAPALNAPKNTITLQDGSSPTPTYPGGTTTTSPSKPKGSAN